MKLSTLLALALFSLATFATYAATVSTTLNIQANIVSSCSALVSQHVNAGDLGDADSTVNSPFSIDITCTNGITYNVALDAGDNYVSNLRRLANGSSYVAYGFLTSPGGSNWGDSDFANTYPFGTSVSGTGTGASQILNGNAQINPLSPTSSISTLGIHSDAVQVTVHY